MRHIVTVSGKDSLAAAIIQREREPNLPYEYVFNDVGMELPETYEWLTKAEKFLGENIVRIGKNLEQLMSDTGILPSPQRRFCTKYGKIFPIQEFVGDDDAVQYVGIRADEGFRTETLRFPENITPSFPLKEAGTTLPDVYNLLDSKGILPPQFFWKRLYDEVIDRATEYSRRWIRKQPPWVSSGLFAWRTRSNCFMCFYQRLHEWVGLLEHHPDLFDRAVELERNPSPDRPQTRTSLFTLNSHQQSLPQIRDRAGEIFEKHVHNTRKSCVRARHNSTADPMALTSCGIYCGK